MIRGYQINVFDLANTYIDTIDPTTLYGDFSFSSNLNWSQWPCTIEYKASIDDSQYNVGNIVRISTIDEFNPNWYLVYTWVVSSIKRISTDKRESIALECLGFTQILTYAFPNWYNTAQDPSLLVQNIVNFVNSLYPWLLIYTPILFWSNLNAGIPQQSSCFEAMDLIQKKTNRQRYIDQNGEMFFWPKPTAPSHILVYKWDVQGVEIEDNWDDIINQVFVRYSVPTSDPNYPYPLQYHLVQDLASIALYWARQKYVMWEIQFTDSKTSPIIFVWPTSIAAAQSTGTNVLRPEPKRSIVLKVNPLFDYAKIKPWDTISIDNIKLQIENLQVLKMNYTNKGCTLYLENLENLGTVWQKLAPLLRR